jgi:hypothetical protein
MKRADRAIRTFCSKSQIGSVTTGRSIEEIAAGKGGKKRVWHSNRVAKTEPSSQSAFKDKIGKIAARSPSRPGKDAARVRRAQTAKKEPREAKIGIAGLRAA